MNNIVLLAVFQLVFVFISIKANQPRFLSAITRSRHSRKATSSDDSFSSHVKDISSVSEVKSSSDESSSQSTQKKVTENKCSLISNRKSYGKDSFIAILTPV